MLGSGNNIAWCTVSLVKSEIGFTGPVDPANLSGMADRVTNLIIRLAISH